MDTTGKTKDSIITKGTTEVVMSTTPQATPPIHRILTLGQSASRRATQRTPTTKPQTTSSFPGQNSARQPATATPYARAARRGLEERRTAALTPGKNRRQSIRQQRETPRDTLRLLSRVLAPTTEVIPSSSPATFPTKDEKLVPSAYDDAQSKFEEGDDDNFDLAPPRLSVALQGETIEGEEDDVPEPPRRTPIPEYLEDDYTQVSVEQSRRARNDRLSRLSRGSFGSVNTSIVYDPDEDSEIYNVNNTILTRQDYNDDEDYASNDQDPTLPRDFMEDLRQPFFTQPFGRYSTASGRVSDVRPEVMPLEEEEDFALVMPEDVSINNDLDEEPQEDGPLSDLHDVDVGTKDDMHVESGKEVETTNDLGNIDNTRANDFVFGTMVRDNDDRRDGNMDSMMSVERLPAVFKAKTKRKIGKMSKHGIQYPSLPTGVVKSLSKTFLQAAGIGKTKLGKDTIQALVQASDWFFEQVSEDVGTYAQHAGRKTIDESDVVTLMRRQRQINATTTPFALAHKYLPRELLQDLRMPAPAKSSRPKRKSDQALEAVEEGEEDDDDEDE